VKERAPCGSGGHAFLNLDSKVTFCTLLFPFDLSFGMNEKKEKTPSPLCDEKGLDGKRAF